MILEPEQEEGIAPPAIDPVLLSLVHQSITQQQATSGDLPVMTVETESAPSVQIAVEQSEGQPEPETESSSIPLTPPASSPIDLVVAAQPIRQEITADFMFQMTAPAKTLFPLIAMVAMIPAILESSTMAFSQ